MTGGELSDGFWEMSRSLLGGGGLTGRLSAPRDESRDWLLGGGGGLLGRPAANIGFLLTICY